MLVDSDLVYKIPEIVIGNKSISNIEAGNPNIPYIAQHNGYRPEEKKKLNEVA